MIIAKLSWVLLKTWKIIHNANKIEHNMGKISLSCSQIKKLSYFFWFSLEFESNPIKKPTTNPEFNWVSKELYDLLK